MKQNYLCPTPLSRLVIPFPSAAAFSCFGVEQCAAMGSLGQHQEPAHIVLGLLSAAKIWHWVNTLLVVQGQSRLAWGCWGRAVWSGCSDLSPFCATALWRKFAAYCT